MAGPSQALERLAEHLREDPVISPHLRDPIERPALGELVAAGPRAAEAPGEYAFLLESIREGYLLHYGKPRLLDGADDDLRLLAGDYLYALGLERLASRGDLEAVQELADLISLAAQLRAEGAGPGGKPEQALWLASTLAVALGSDPDHDRAKALLRSGEAAAGARELAGIAARRAAEAGLGDQLAARAEQVGFAVRILPKRG